MTKTYYKVVRTDIDPDTMFSAITSKLKYSLYHRYEKNKNNLIVQYKLNEWVFPKIVGSKLFVFDNLHDANNFAWNYYYTVYECEIKNPHKSCPFYKYVLDSPVHVLTMWKLYKQKKKFSHLNSVEQPPIGTVVCDAVKLTKKVKKNLWCESNPGEKVSIL